MRIFIFKGYKLLGLTTLLQILNCSGLLQIEVYSVLLQIENCLVGFYMHADFVGDEKIVKP